MEVVTDLVPSVEFDAVELSLPEEGEEPDQGVSVDSSSDFQIGFVVGQFSKLERSSRRSLVARLMLNGQQVLTRTYVVSNEIDARIRLVLTRSCVGVECPLESGNPSAEACLGGQCVSPDCIDGTQEACEEFTPECVSDDGCTVTASCQTAECSEGVCLLFAQDDACAEGEFCADSLGCQPTVVEEAIDTPLVVFPWNGYRTGSLHAETATLRPSLRWEPVSQEVVYQVQIDDSCGPEFAGCSFPSPEVSAQTTETFYQPELDLPVSEEVPVGRRYYLRVRACVGVVCGAYSAVHYVDVGRVGGDLNGDGYSELIAGAPDESDVVTGQGATYVHAGGPSGPSAGTYQRLSLSGSAAGDGFGERLEARGDYNADGFVDLVVGSPFADQASTDEGQVYVYYGSSAGLPSAPSLTLSAELGVTDGLYGYALASGDLDGDGYADLAVGEPVVFRTKVEQGRVFVYAGGAEGLSSSPSFVLDRGFAGQERTDEFGGAIDGGGDLNGDGFVDLAVGAPSALEGADGGEGTVSIFSRLHLGDTTSEAVVSAVPRSEGQGGDFSGCVGIAPDENGDGFSDLLVAAADADIDGINLGAAYVFRGSRNGVSALPDSTVTSDTTRNQSRFGYRCRTGGDYNGDGRSDLLVVTDPSDTQRVFFFLSDEVEGWGSGSEGSHRIPFPVSSDEDIGEALEMRSDYNGDGYSDIAVGAPGTTTVETEDGAVHLFFGAPTGLPTNPNLTVPQPEPSASARYGSSVG